MENEHVKAISRLNNSGTNNYIEDVPTLQSLLRELEKKIELETVHYEELMLELTLTKKHEKVNNFIPFPIIFCTDPQTKSFVFSVDCF